MCGGPAAFWATSVGSRFGSALMKFTSFQVCSTDSIDFHDGIPVRATPFWMIQKSSASVQCCTCGEVRSIAGGYIAVPSWLSAWPSAEWHNEQDRWYICDPSWIDSGVEPTGFLRFFASTGITTSFAASAKACSTVEGFRCAEQFAIKNAEQSRIAASLICRLNKLKLI